MDELSYWLIFNGITVWLTTMAIPWLVSKGGPKANNTTRNILVPLNATGWVVVWTALREAFIGGPGGTYILYGVGIASLIAWGLLSAQSEQKPPVSEIMSDAQLAAQMTAAKPPSVPTEKQTSDLAEWLQVNDPKRLRYQKPKPEPKPEVRDALVHTMIVLTVIGAGIIASMVGAGAIAVATSEQSDSSTINMPVSPAPSKTAEQQAARSNAGRSAALDYQEQLRLQRLREGRESREKILGIDAESVAAKIRADEIRAEYEQQLALQKAREDSEAEQESEFYRSAQIAAKLYPVAASDTSKFYLWMDSIDKELDRKGHPLFNSPNKPLIIAYCAAWVLGVEATAPLVPLNATDKAYFNEVTAEIRAELNEAKRKAVATQTKPARPHVYVPSETSRRLDALESQMEEMEQQRLLESHNEMFEDIRRERQQKFEDFKRRTSLDR